MIAKPCELTIGDRVNLRGRKPTGCIRQINSNLWCKVDWDICAIGPKIVHLNELERTA